MTVASDRTGTAGTHCYHEPVPANCLHRPSLLGLGLYAPGDAARMASLVAEKPVSGQAVRRWLWGYSYRRDGDLRTGPPLWEPQVGTLDGDKVLTFRDLIEVLFVAVFRSKGVSLQTIRRVIERAGELFELSHPLSSLSFKTDGKTILADTVDDQERRLIFDLDTGQYLLELVFGRLRAGLDYTDLLAARWWPLGKKHLVVLDPERSFGRPIVVEEGVPTAALAGAFRAERSVGAVAHWFGVSEEAVQDALRYEARLAKAA